MKMPKYYVLAALVVEADDEQDAFKTATDLADCICVLGPRKLDGVRFLELQCPVSPASDKWQDLDQVLHQVALESYTIEEV
jgi:hypothetical protein